MTPCPNDQRETSVGHSSTNTSASPTSSSSIGTGIDGSTKSKSTKDPATVIVHPPNAPPYIKCESMEPFVGPTADGADASTEKEELNLNLGQNIITPNNKRLLWTIRFLSSVFVEWWEHVFYIIWDKCIPLRVKRALVFGGWKLYLPLHKLLLGRRTAIHPDASLEYHALTSLMYWGRFIPISVQRMRFSLSQLHVWTPSPMTAGKVNHISQKVVLMNNDMADETKTGTSTSIPSSNTTNNNNETVKGIFLHRNADQSPTDGTIFWIYGGAFLAGDAAGNTAIADVVGNALEMDVFIPTFRLAPEVNMDEIVYDVCLSYRWLCQQRPTQKIQLLGISSGGALCTRLMQLIAEHGRGEEIVPSIVEPLLQSSSQKTTMMRMPCGAVLLGPFVDYTPAKGSLLENAKYDHVVHDRVLESGLPYLETHIPEGRREEYSPVHRSCQGLPPLCVVLSLHEAVYDMTVQLINRARSDGVPVTVGCWKYVCHVFSFLHAFIPEGRVSMEFILDWMRQRHEQVKQQQEEEEQATALAQGVGEKESS